MIRYALNCTAGHGFESWFQSAGALDKLLTSGLVSCPVCGVVNVAKALMAPAVVAVRPGDTLRSPQDARQAALEAMRAEILAKSEYVGMDFVAEARAIFDGDAPERSIYGEARPEEAIQLLRDGVPVTPLPFMPLRKVN